MWENFLERGIYDFFFFQVQPKKFNILNTGLSNKRKTNTQKLIYVGMLLRKKRNLS